MSQEVRCIAPTVLVFQIDKPLFHSSHTTLHNLPLQPSTCLLSLLHSSPHSTVSLCCSLYNSHLPARCLRSIHWQGPRLRETRSAVSDLDCSQVQSRFHLLWGRTDHSLRRYYPQPRRNLPAASNQVHTLAHYCPE